MMAIYFNCGLGLASWASRLPAIRDALGVTESQVGLLLFAGGLASIVGLSAGSYLLVRLGARRGTVWGMLQFSAGIALIGIGAQGLRSYLLVSLGFAFWGAGVGAVDVIMNVEGASFERAVGRSTLPLLHGFFSVGSMVGAGLGLLAAQFGVSVLLHLSLAAAAMTALALLCTGGIPPTELSAPPGAKVSSRGQRVREIYSAWKEHRVYLLGLTVIGSTLAEGGANDWLALAVVDGHEETAAVGAAVLAVFASSMATVRITGGRLIDRFGRAPTHRALSLLTALGITIVILAPAIWAVYVGALLWGTGCALGFPIGMSAAADDPERAVARVGAVAAIGYLAFLVGPPLLGFVAQRVGILGSFVILGAFAILSAVTAGATRPESP